jgi:exonuclease III
MKDENIQVFGIAETFLKSDEPNNLDGSYNWYGKNRINKGGGGIGFIIDKGITIVDDNALNSKLDDYERLWIKVCLNTGRIMYIAVTYFPVEGSDPDGADALYNQLLSEIIRIEDCEDEDPDILIMGDMNGRIGSEIPYGDPILNYNGKRLLHFAEDSDLTILNCTRHCIGKITWSRGNQQSTIDYMLCSNNLVKHVKRLLVDEDRHYGLGSDHNVLLLTLNNKSALNKTKTKTNSNKKIVWDIKDKDFTAYQNQVGIHFIDWDTNSFDNPDSLWDSWKHKVISAASKGLGVKEVKSKCNSWFNNDIDQAIKDRRNAAGLHRKWVKALKGTIQTKN